ncbi:MAG: tyrosine-type recombinase/integrase [Clostridiales Family XIII bacterium]|jgi:integrase/recombinase XerD|nr:tyrosine-type recombinase/integrase [Clostridiales Family XIII bacterium]
MEKMRAEFVDYMTGTRKLAANSIAAYLRDIAEFDAFLSEKGGSGIEKARQADVAAYVLRLKRDGRSSATINRRLASLRAFYGFMAAKGRGAVNPVMGVRPPKVTRRDIEYLSLDEVEALLGQPDGSVKGVRDRAILELMYATGLRVSEVTAADLEHVNLRMGFVTCTGEHGKARIIPLGRPARAALEEYIFSGRAMILRGKGGGGKALFLNYCGERMSRQSIWKMLKEYAAASIRKKITPQILRNSFAVHMAQNGADLKSLQELMGHEDILATQAYLNTSRNRIKDVYDSAHPRA